METNPNILEGPSTLTAEQMEALIRFTFMISSLAAVGVSMRPDDPRIMHAIDNAKKAEQDMLALFLNLTQRERFTTIAKAAQAAATQPRIIL